MGIAETSRESYGRESANRLTRERELFRLLQDHRDGLSDRQIGEMMGITNALASARRNGLKYHLKGTVWQIYAKCKEVDEKTLKRVNIWILRRGTLEKQDSFNFNSRRQQPSTLDASGCPEDINGPKAF